MLTQLDSEPASPYTAPIAVVPGHPRYAEGVERLMAVSYACDPQQVDTCITAAKFLHHLLVFPEGQFVAVDTDTDQVIGYTSSMRLDFDPAQPFLEPWIATTDFG